MLCDVVMASDLSDEQLRSIYAWIDAIPLSRPKRNIARDFSDGCMMAEVIAAYFPDMVELHNYSPANSLQQKIYNYETLNKRVLKRFDFQLDRSTIDDIVNCKHGVVESVLNSLQYKMAKYRERKSSGARARSPQSPSESSADRRSKVSPANRKTPSKTRGQAPSSNKPAGPANRGRPTVQSSVDEQLLLEKEEHIRELEETVEILELKIAKLEQLVRLKDNKIQKLTQK